MLKFLVYILYPLVLLKTQAYKVISKLFSINSNFI
nr:MAG TPA: hypothetical protein [Caudoviricetes sp.]